MGFIPRASLSKVVSGLLSYCSSSLPEKRKSQQEAAAARLCTVVQSTPALLRAVARPVAAELELELIQSHMAQKPVLRGEVGCACVAREVSVGGSYPVHPDGPTNPPNATHQVPAAAPCAGTCFLLLCSLRVSSSEEVESGSGASAPMGFDDGIACLSFPSCHTHTSATHFARRQSPTGPPPATRSFWPFAARDKYPDLRHLAQRVPSSPRAVGTWKIGGFSGS